MAEPSGTGGRPDLRTPLAEAKRGSAAPITQAEQDPGVRSELRDAGPRAPRYKSTSKFLSSVPCGSMFPCSRRDVSMSSLSAAWDRPWPSSRLAPAVAAKNGAQPTNLVSERREPLSFLALLPT